ncbi:flagellar export protein FliJ [Undibacterium sp. LX15W]|uniref:Flagellar FliJ protein n=2 Tax=Undibacterium flavidum TaxID=2762297 RepID=A0ABR6Y810_9BURK|nr:flagellar export protein FliJ [Undibacterium flavidum]
MMASSALLTLIELAINDVENAAKNLGRCIKARDDANTQLNLLHQYRNDYVNRFQANAQTGLNVTQFTNFQGFINKLDQAIEGQKKIVADAEYKIELARKNWQECEKKRLSYKTLIDRNAAAEVIKENKRDQKQTDERAGRTLFYKK